MNELPPTFTRTAFSIKKLNDHDSLSFSNLKIVAFVLRVNQIESRHHQVVYSVVLIASCRAPLTSRRECAYFPI